MSIPTTFSNRPLLLRSLTTVSPIALGRRGDRVENTPCGLLSVGGVLIKSYPSTLSNSQMTYKCEKPSMSFSPSSNSGTISSVPLASWCAPQPFGIWESSLYGLLTVPIDLMVTMWNEIPVFTYWDRQRQYFLPSFLSDGLQRVQLFHIQTQGFLLRYQWHHSNRSRGYDNNQQLLL
jgi:hypothetical protein